MRKDIRERLQRLSAPDIQSGCWNWRRAVGSSGYPHIKVGGRERSAARVSFEAFCGPMPDGYEPDHLCRNRRCINPGHIEAVTRAENIRRRELHRAHPGLCKNGHLLTAARTRAEGGRYCRICVRDSKRRQRAKLSQ
jgi:hypothetical protein